jgi:hypothetical protein
MESCGTMGTKVSTCLYIDKGVLETAHRIGLNVSKISENSLVEAIARLGGSEPGTAPKKPMALDVEGRGRDLNPGARLHRPIGYQATSPRPLLRWFRPLFTLVLLIYVSSEILSLLFGIHARIRFPTML